MTNAIVAAYQASFAAAPAPASGITIVQATRVAGSFGTSHNASFPSAVSGGSLIVFCLSHASDRQPQNLVDDKSNTYTPTYSVTASGSDVHTFYVKENVTNSPQTFSWTTAGGTVPEVFLYELANARTTDPVDLTRQSSSGFGTAHSWTTTVATNHDNEAAVTLSSSVNGSSWTLDTAGWAKLDQGGSDIYTVSAYIADLGAAAVETVSFTLGTSTTSVSSGITIRKAT